MLDIDVPDERCRISRSGSAKKLLSHYPLLRLLETGISIDVG
jgi:hypothetical protein